MTTVEKRAPTRFDVVGGSAALFIGGSCSETDVSAGASVQLAVAAGAEQVLAKPGMGVDEAVAITRNEMQRVCM